VTVGRNSALGLCMKIMLIMITYVYNLIPMQVGGLPCPYKDEALAHFGGDQMKPSTRYSLRPVIHLAGGNDTDHLRSSCEDDDFQGISRLQRSPNFFESLKIIFGEKTVHKRMVADNVIHDHTLKCFKVV